MSKPTLEFSAEVIEKHPSLKGVVPPMLRLTGSVKEMNIPLDIDGFFEDLDHFIKEFGYMGEYHTPEHFVDVEQRFLRDLEFLKGKHQSEFDDRDLLRAKMAARSHDVAHNAYGKRQPAYFLTVNSICALYGFAPNGSHMVPSIIEAMNVGIEEDNALNNGSRPLVTGADDPIGLSEEEMSQIIEDAFAFRNGFSFDFRCEISGMIQATEFKRSMVDGKPDFKWPRTQMELLMKLADIGNFCEQVSSWLDTSVKVNTELPFFTGTTALEFINEELFFINTYVKPVLDAKNQPTILDIDGNHIPARVPDYYYTSIEEKERYLLHLRSEIERITEQIELGNELPESKELSEFCEAIRPALGKTDPRLLDQEVPVPLVQGVAPELRIPAPSSDQARTLK